METNKTKTQVYNLIILDKSGSMFNIKKEAVAGYNETLGSIKSAQLKHYDTQGHYISLAAFCGCGVDMIYDCTPVKDAEKMTTRQYAPCCGTPLYDAIGKSVTALINKTKTIEDVAVLVTIITDGMENASREWDGHAIKRLIAERKEEGWMFSYIGADHDVEKVAASISITNTVVWTKTAEGTEAMIDNENMARARYFAKMASCDATAPCMSVSEKKKWRKQFSEEYYKK